MSESYPKSNAWPFVLSGLLLFGLVLSPPTEWSSTVRSAYVDWFGVPSPKSTAHRATKPADCRVVVVHDPWAPSSSIEIAKELTPAPSIITKTVSISPTAPEQATLFGDKAAPKQRNSFSNLETPNITWTQKRYVWQPASDWVPTLIEPFPAQTQVSAKFDKLPIRSLAVAPIAEPVARLEQIRKPRRTRTRTPENHSFSELIEPIDSGAFEPETEIASESDLAEDGFDPSAEQEAPLPKEPPRANSLPTEPIASGKQSETSDLSKNLQDLLNTGAKLDRLEKWSKQLRCRVVSFNSQRLTGNSKQREALERIGAVANYPVDISNWHPIEQQTYWRIRHAIQRRTDVWKPLLQTAASESEHARQTRSHLVGFTSQLSDQLKSNSATQPWAKYLKLNNLIDDSDYTRNNLHESAEITLGLLRSSSLSDYQQDFLSAPVFRKFESDLRAVISANIAATDLAAALEQYEDNANATNAKMVVAYLQRFGTGPHTERFVPTLQAIDTHYRNANLRVAVSQDLINRFVPAFHQYAEQVNDTILGAAVRGRNSTLTNLSVELIPDPNAIRVGLLAKGLVDSDTASRKGPVVVYNRGTSRFAAGKELVVGPNGIFLGQTETRATTGNRLVGMKTDLDQFPILGWLVRNVARQQHDEQRPFLRAEVLQRVRKGASQKIDVEVQRRLANVEHRVQSQVVQPLRDMNLDPRAMEMTTTCDRAILRTRLAGPLQLGANSPRPQARSDSKMSFHIHQSAANNMVEQFDLQGRRMTLGELATELSSRFGMDIEIAEKRRDTIVEFASDTPLDFKFEDGQVQVTIHFAELYNGEDRWENFSVRGFYRADVRQMDVELIRDGSIELITESLRLRDQIALRSIFTKVFANNQRFELLRRAIEDQPKLRSLTVTQFTIRDGWIAMSLGEVASDSRVATAPTSHR